MQARYRDQHYFIYVRPNEVDKIDKNSFLEAHLFEELAGGKVDTGKVLHLSLGGNKRGIEASLKHSKNVSDVYIDVSRAGRRKLRFNKPILSRYDRGTIMIQVARN